MVLLRRPQFLAYACAGLSVASVFALFQVDEHKWLLNKHHSLGALTLPQAVSFHSQGETRRSETQGSCLSTIANCVPLSGGHFSLSNSARFSASCCELST